MATTTFSSPIIDQELIYTASEGGENTWAAAHDAGSAIYAGSDIYHWKVSVGKTIGGYWYIQRAFVEFNTTSIPVTNIITGATLSVYVYTTPVDQDADGYDYISVLNSNLLNPGSMTLSDYSRAGTTEQHNVSERKVISSISSGAYLNFVFNATGIASIGSRVIDGQRYSQFVLREGHDLQNHSFHNVNGEHNSIECYRTSWGSNIAKLVVIHISVPTITTQAVTDKSFTSGTGNGNITATGDVNATRRGFCYKVGISGDPTIADSVVYDDGDFGIGAFTKGITGLLAGMTYRVRAYAVNSVGTSYGDTVSYTTTASPFASHYN